jgi:hypothetical protein
LNGECVWRASGSRRSGVDDPERELSFALLTTGLTEESFHLERTGAFDEVERVGI